METKPCVYCTNTDIKTRLIAENDLAWAFPTNIPITPGHTLVVPKRCVASLAELTDAEFLAIKSLATQIMGGLKKIVGSEGFNCVWNQGKLAGQSVPHFHLHIISRKEGDSGLAGFDIRSYLYRTGDREPTPETELAKVAQQIKESL